MKRRSHWNTEIPVMIDVREAIEVQDRRGPNNMHLHDQSGVCIDARNGCRV